jgi:hypothetical protein
MKSVIPTRKCTCPTQRCQEGKGKNIWRGWEDGLCGIWSRKQSRFDISLRTTWATASAAPVAPGALGQVYVNDNTAGTNTIGAFDRLADGRLVPTHGSRFLPVEQELDRFLGPKARSRSRTTGVSYWPPTREVTRSRCSISSMTAPSVW